MIFLPGTDKQFKFLLENYSPQGKSVLVAGSGTDSIADNFLGENALNVEVITDDSSDLMNLRLRSKGRFPVKLMDFTNTDFTGGSFDLVYSQASFSTSNRRKIFRELSRILNENGIICIGEIISSTTETPPFMIDIWNAAGLYPLTIDSQLEFYDQAGFYADVQSDLSYTLRDFYNSGKTLLSDFKEKNSEDNLKYYKKLINKMSHESNAYLKLGGSRYMAFHSFILRRKD